MIYENRSHHLSFQVKFYLENKIVVYQNNDLSYGQHHTQKVQFFEKKTKPFGIFQCKKGTSKDLPRP